MGDGDTTPVRSGDESDRPCGRCSSTMSLLTRLPATSENAAFSIFGCSACQFVDWIAEQVSE